LFDVLASVQLDNDVGLETSKVTDIGSKRVLAAKLEAVHLPAPQTTPKETFGIGGALAEVSRKAEHLCIGSCSIGTNEARLTTTASKIHDPSVAV
jgi:hypothetical protein